MIEEKQFDELCILFSRLATKYQSFIGIMGVLNEREGYKITQMLAKHKNELNTIIWGAKEVAENWESIKPTSPQETSEGED